MGGFYFMGVFFIYEYELNWLKLQNWFHIRK
jgi:hypothetical protein